MIVPVSRDAITPVTESFNKVLETIGVFSQPYLIEQKAKAESKAAIIRTKTQVECELMLAENKFRVSEIEQRGIESWCKAQGIKQANVESIANKARTKLEASAKPEDIKPDWLLNFSDKARLVSDTEMQERWADLLAGETNKPGSFSKATLEILSGFGKEEADLIENLSSFCISKDIAPLPIVFVSTNNDVYSRKDINFDSLSYLEALGILKFDALTGFARSFPKETAYISLSYHNRNIIIKTKEGSFNSGSILLTRIGNEIIKLCKYREINEFPEFLVKKYIELGFECRAE